MNCIFCKNKIEKFFEEHIVPESLGNTKYFLKQEICYSCNNKFSRFENKAITKSILGLIRIQQGIKTKKKKPGTVNLAEFEATGVEALLPDTMFFKQNDSNTHSIIEEGEQRTITFNPFNRTESASSKLFLKVGFEALYKSKYKIFKKYEFHKLKEYLLNKDLLDWPFLVNSVENHEFLSIPQYSDKNHLNKINCKLRYNEVDSNTLLFNFKYHYFSVIINLIDRNIEWSKAYIKNDNHACIFPKYFHNK